MAGGKIVRIVGGTFETHCKNLTYYQDNFTINAGGKIELTADGEMTYGEPEKPQTGKLYIIRGWWSYDEEGEHQIKEARLGDIVFFHIETRYIPDYNKANDERDPDLSRLHIQGWEYNYDSFFGIYSDYFSPDSKLDKEANGAPKYAYIKNNRACIEVQIKDDAYMFNMVREDDSPGDLEFYFTVTYAPKTVPNVSGFGLAYESDSLPVSFGDYLRVKLPKIPDLYFIQPSVNYQFPEIRTEEGNIIFMQFLRDEVNHTENNLRQAGQIIKDKMIERIKEKATDKATAITAKKIEHTYTLAIRELETGKMVNSLGEIVYGKKIYDNKDIHMIDGSIRTVKRAKNIGFKIAYVNEGKLVTTKGINQLEYFSQQVPIRAKAEFGKKLLEVLDLKINIAGWFSDISGGGLPQIDVATTVLSFFPSYASSQLGWMSLPIAIMVNEASANLQKIMDDAFGEALIQATDHGIKEVEKFFAPDTTSFEWAKDRGFEFHEISGQTLTKLLKKEFEEFKILEKEFDMVENGPKHSIIIRAVWNQDYKEYHYFIYCIFVNNEILN